MFFEKKKAEKFAEEAKEEKYYKVEESKGNETSDVREWERERKRKKKHIVKHTAKKFKMSDFCILFLSVENGAKGKTKTFSYDSVDVTRLGVGEIELDRSKAACFDFEKISSMLRSTFPANAIV